jgi:ABC-2 type transport system permease protein
MVRPALLILAKDLRLRLRDRSVLLFGVVVPLGLTVLFSFVFPDMDDLQVTAAVVDHDGGSVANAFTDELLPVLVDDGVVVLVEAQDEAAARVLLADGDVSAAWVLPEGLSDAVAAGRPAQIDVLVNPDRGLAAEVARGIASGFAIRVDQVTLAVATAAVSGADPQQLEQVAEGAAITEPLVTIRPLVAQDAQLDPISHLSAGMAAFFVFFIVQYGVMGLLEERQQGTMPRLLAAPISPNAIQVGKAAGAFVLGVLSLTVLTTASRLLLGASWGPWLGTAVLIVALVLAATGLMAFVGSFARTAEQAGNLQAIVAVSLGMLGGVFFPVGEGILATVAAVSPHGWFLRGLGAQTATGDWTAVFPAAAAVAAFGAVAAIPAVVRLRRAVTW